MAQQGFPNVTEARFVIQDPTLRDLPAGNEVFGGQSIARIDEAGTMRPTSGLLMPHGTYDTDLAGDYLGGFEMGITAQRSVPRVYFSKTSSRNCAIRRQSLICLLTNIAANEPRVARRRDEISRI